MNQLRINGDETAKSGNIAPPEATVPGSRGTSHTRILATVPQSQWRAAPNPAAGSQEAEWFDANIGKLQAYAGLWVAIRGRGIRASSDKLEEILDWLATERVVDALVLRVPDDLTQTRFMLA